MNGDSHSADAQMPAVPQSLGQFQLRHLLGMMAAVSVLFAVLAFQVQDLTLRSKIAAVLQMTALVLLLVSSLLWTLSARRRVERLAGQPIIQVRRLSPRLLHWGVVTGFVVSYLALTPVTIQNARPDEVVNLLPNPYHLCLALNYFVVRIWWRIDPTAPEACENGLIRRGMNFVAWDSISRHTWSGPKKLQLNLFLNNRVVIHFHTDPQFAQQVERLLADRSGEKMPMVAAPG
jgi:hypothetical protein